ncbi:unnamed protein product [Caenorhabditis brenneri]
MFSNIECSKRKLCCYALIFILIGVYLILTETDLFKKDESKFERDAPQCLPLFQEANLLITSEIDSTKKILEDPDKYANISAKCEEAIECAEHSQVSMKSYHLDGKYNPCVFFVFYYNRFSPCARTLMAKVGDQIPCIEAVFHEKYQNKTEKCEALKSSQPCLVRAIVNACDMIPGDRVAKNYNKKDFYADEVYNLIPAFCKDLLEN